MITIDGSMGEGGGQILRSSLALAALTGKDVRLERIRAGRSKPGLMQQHLTSVRAAAAISRADLAGDELGSQQLTFRPRSVQPGEYRFAVGTAGSALLVLQTVLPPLLVAEGTSTLKLSGGTHNSAAPPFDFMVHAFLPLIARLGPQVSATLVRHGFYPAGGGKLEVTIEPASLRRGFELLERGTVNRRRARALVARLPRTVGERELAVIRERLGWNESECQTEEVAHSKGPGNAICLTLECEHVTEVVTAFGSRGVLAEEVARQAADEAQSYLAAEVPVGEHLADQLLLPLALAGGGSFRTVEPSLHTRTNAEVLTRFLPVKVEFDQQGAQDYVVTVS